MMPVKWNFILFFLLFLMAGYRKIKFIGYCKGATQSEKKARKENPFPNSQIRAHPPADQKTQKKRSNKRQAKLTKERQILDDISPFFHKSLLSKVSFYRQILTQFAVDSNFYCENCLKTSVVFIAYRQFFHIFKNNFMLTDFSFFVFIQYFRID